MQLTDVECSVIARYLSSRERYDIIWLGKGTADRLRTALTNVDEQYETVAQSLLTALADIDDDTAVNIIREVNNRCRTRDLSQIIHYGG